MTFTVLGAMLIGITLGLLGSGGSAVTVPVLVYLVGHGGKQAITESMAIVAMISLVAVIPYARRHQVSWRHVWGFGIPGMAGTLLGAWVGESVSEVIQLVVFGGVLLVVAMAMFWPVRPTVAEASPEVSGQGEIWPMVMQGAGVGVLTGFAGVGGGFLIVPALVLLSGLPMRLAVGTSLVIIAINSSTGFLRYEHVLSGLGMGIDWRTIAMFGGIGMAGSVLGRLISTHLDQQKLKRVFAGFLLCAGSFILIHEGSKLWAGPL